MKGKLLFVIITSFSLLVLTACSHNEVKLDSPMVFYGESETWGATLEVKQVQHEGDHTFKITQISNLTYKGNPGDKNHTSTRGNSTSVQVSIEGVSPESGSSIRLQEYNTWRQKSNPSTQYGVEEDENFEVIVTWNNKEETFTLSQNNERTPQINRYNTEEVDKVLNKPQKNGLYSF
ncbi:hypothetical protein [Halobacillus halophilus]|uniref:hypothetical protein n=1 Tax=Halobacillus halophilus TaxID=1570 RepID=UPI001CD3CDA4|nr:hypothetical protein [Halobacillus halophilus]MCA1010579.1 hypothetical protein [Halobacillus halophilus]